MRVKTGIRRKQHHRKILKANKGYRMLKSKTYKVAHEAYMHAGQYAHDHRKKRAGQMRRIWIDRLNSAAKANGLKYSELIKKLKDASILLNRKILSEIALSNPEVFSSLVKSL